MNKLRIGYDDNLGLASDFTTKIGCEIVSYHDLGKLITSYEQKELDAMFIPGGTLPYLENYQIIAQSFLNNEKENSLQTIFVTTKDLNLQNIAKSTLGRVNKYCTTSYWAPSIYLMQHLPKGTKLNFQNTNGFVDMLDKTAKGKLDGSMVWDIILQQDKKSADQVHALFSLSNLPSPVIVARDNFPEATRQKLTQFNTTDKKAFFHGFQQPNMPEIEKFQQAIKNAVQFYNIDLNQ